MMTTMRCYSILFRGGAPGLVCRRGLALRRMCVIIHENNNNTAHGFWDRSMTDTYTYDDDHDGGQGRETAKEDRAKRRRHLRVA